MNDKNCSVEMRGNGGNGEKDKCPGENCAGCSGSDGHGEGKNCTCYGGGDCHGEGENCICYGGGDCHGEGENGIGCSGGGCPGGGENGCAGGCPHAVGGAFEWDYDDTVLVFSSDMLEESATECERSENA